MVVGIPEEKEKEEGQMDDAGCWEFPTDVLVEILQRLPPSSRRRSRLVCRHWRDAVDERTTEMRSRAKVLFWNAYNSVAYVVDDLSSSSTGSCTEIWSRPDGYRRPYSGTQPVATCNGLLCLCNNAEMPGGALTLVNPATGEALPVPLLPCEGIFDGIDHWNWWVFEKWDQAYTFAYHPISGKYKVVHVPCRFDYGHYDHREFNFSTVQVLTLGEASWREVPAGPAGAARCHRGAGIISIDGTTYWTTEGSFPKVVSFDLEHERITSFTPLPVQPETPDFYHLTEVHGRLGVVIRDRSYAVATEVWILEKGCWWSHRYSLSNRSLARPLFGHGEYVLTVHQSLYGHYTGRAPWLPGEVVRVSHQDHKTVVAKVEIGYSKYPSGTFAYVETTEPLSAYATN
ncbi:hypothetical protein QYE76_019904 [Lolium multiflorum]|uniref:F-box domain-containing protein n=1 Tax=Lolium multiflorum TaxID=4521 RepID=A0AAD8VNL0_LOLMU|nr:hypothetical protein QYE76_019903 [Lolium multiflorum]KAK1614387.1 hypothetical protein QYE76_019904 [Lolium multiflorum]